MWQASSALRLASIKIRWASDRCRTQQAFAFASARPYRQAQTRTKFAGFQRALSALWPELKTSFAQLGYVEWQFWAVLLAAVAAMAVTQYNIPFWYGGSDHSDYYWYGRFLLGDGFRGYSVPANWRTPGMGLFHILTGTVFFDTWTLYIAVNAAFSAAIPVLYYLMVRPHSRSFALLAGLGTIASMIPYIYAYAPASDEVYFFFHALLLLLCVRYFQRRIQSSPALLYSIVGVAAAACLVRPVGALIFWIFVFLAAIWRPHDWRRLAAAGGIYMILMSAWVLWDRSYGTNGGAATGLGYPQLNEFTTSAERRLAEAYFTPQGLVHAESADAASDYAASRALRDVLHKYFVDHQFDWRQPSLYTPASLFAAYADKPNAADNLLAAVFNDRNYIYFSFIVRTVKETLGADAGLALLYNVATEHGTTGLYGILRNFLIHPTRLLFGVTPDLAGTNMFAVLYLAKYRENEMGLASIKGIPDPLLSPQLGPATVSLTKTLRRFIDDYPQYWPKRISGPYQGNPDGFYQFMLRGGVTDQAVDVEGFLYQSVNWYLTPALAGKAYLPVALEILKQYPKLAMLYYENFLYLTVLRRFGSVEKPLDRDTLDNMSDGYLETMTQVTDDLPRGLAKGLVPVIKAGEVKKDVAALHAIFYLIAPAFLFLMIVSLPFLRGDAAIGACLFLIVNYGFEAVTITMFSPWGAPRYEANFYLLPLFVSCIILGQAVSRLRNQRSAPLAAG
jgi:hypothetical protein